MKRIRNYIKYILLLMILAFTTSGIGTHTTYAAANADDDIVWPEKPKIVSVTNTVKGVKIKWKKVPGVDSYFIYRRLENAEVSIFIAFDRVEDPNIVTYTDIWAEPGKEYMYAVASCKDNLLSGYTVEDKQRIIRIIPASIKLNKSSATLYVGSQLTLNATVTGSSTKVKWTSSNAKIATVKNGKVTAKKAGKATIKARANGKTAKCTITVKKAPSVYKKITPKVKASIGKKTFSMEESSAETGYYPIFVTEGGTKKKLIPENDASVVTTNGTFLYYSTRYSGIYRYDINTGEKVFIVYGDQIVPLYCDGTYLYYGDQIQYIGTIETLKIMNMKTYKVVTSPYLFADDIQPVKNRLLVSGTGRPHGSPLYFINKDGTNATLITKEYVNELKISGNYIYYQETTPNWTVRSCRCNLNGKNIKVLKDWHSLL